MAKKKTRNNTGRKPKRGEHPTSLQNLRRGGGRPPGVPNKVTSEAKAACNAIVDDPTYRAALFKRMVAGKAGPMEPLVWYYAKGKPKERVELGADEKLADLIRQAAGLPPLPRLEED